jgi:N-acetylneuraminic acid mutarotase
MTGMQQFVGSWERYNDYPLHVAESAGGFIGNDGNDLLIVSGFHDDWGKATDKVYALDTTQTPFEWERMDDLPMDDVEIPWSKSKTGISHTAFVIVKDVYYMCGGYVGGNPGPETNACFKYNHSIRPGNGEQWSRLPNLPKGRAGGGLVYDSGKNALYFSAGAIRPRANDRHAEDQDETWMLPLDDVEDPNKEAKWNELAPAELTSNHIGFVSAKDGTGNERYFFYGGQDGEDEPDGNYDDMYEYLPSSNTWEARKSMPFGRGHTSASTRPIGCGFIIAGGAINGGWVKTNDVTFYDIDEDKWTKIGELPDKINTPVCDINGEWLYCQSGHISKEFSYRRKIKVEGGSQ